MDTHVCVCAYTAQANDPQVHTKQRQAASPTRLQPHCPPASPANTPPVLSRQLNHSTSNTIFEQLIHRKCLSQKSVGQSTYSADATFSQPSIRKMLVREHDHGAQTDNFGNKLSSWTNDTPWASPHTVTHTHGTRPKTIRTQSGVHACIDTH